MNLFELTGNGVKILLADANDDIPDNVIAESIRGTDGYTYRSGNFDRLVLDDNQTHPVYIVKVEKWPPALH